jgi:hypothetical protein
VTGENISAKFDRNASQLWAQSDGSIGGAANRLRRRREARPDRNQQVMAVS